MFMEEMKKIWRPGMFLILIMLGFFFQSMFLDFYLRNFPDRLENPGEFYMGMELVERYGTSLSFEEAEELQTYLLELYTQADAYVKEFSLCEAHNLSSFQDYQTFRRESLEAVQGLSAANQNSDYADSMIMENFLNGTATHFIEGRIGAAESFLRKYQAIQEGGNQALIGNNELSAREADHAQELFFEKDTWQNILISSVPRLSSRFFGSLLIWLCVSVLILLSPLLVRDRMSRMVALQWSSRCGRGIGRIQLRVMMVSAFLLTTGNLLIFGGRFVSKGFLTFLSCRLYSFLSDDFSWPNWSYALYLAALILLCYLVSLGCAFLSFWLSRYSDSYISMLLKLIPVIVLVALLSPNLLGSAFYYSNLFYGLTGCPYVEGIIAGAAFLVPVILCLYALRRQWKEDFY